MDKKRETDEDFDKPIIPKWVSILLWGLVIVILIVALGIYFYKESSLI